MDLHLFENLLFLSVQWQYLKNSAVQIFPFVLSDVFKLILFPFDFPAN